MIVPVFKLGLARCLRVLAEDVNSRLFEVFIACGTTSRKEGVASLQPAQLR